tara:strand:+ start:325 stop:792 length:468 start_codon:yes stop_codon:yes gene_type:complete
MNRLLISHRGNLRGSIPELENTPSYILKAISRGYVCEIDIWYVDGGFYLGHDEPTTSIGVEWLLALKSSIIIHAKNIDAIIELSKTLLHYFWHENDKCTITSKGWIWCYPGIRIDTGSKAPMTVCVLPEAHDQDITNFSAICSDKVEKYDKASSL